MRWTLSLVLVLFASAGMAAGQVANPAIAASLPSGQPVGTAVQWTASAQSDKLLQYRFSISFEGAAFRMTRDWSVAQTLDWVPVAEGAYVVRAEIRQKLNPGTVVSAESAFAAVSRLADGQPLVTLTPNELVGFYSAPPQPSGALLRVQFRRAGTGEWLGTPYVACREGRSVNLHVAGMRASSSYEIRHEVDVLGVHGFGPVLLLSTGALPVALPPLNVQKAPDEATSTGDRFHVISAFPPDLKPLPVAVDLEGQVVWYFHRFREAIWIFTNLVEGGTLLLLKSEGDIQGQYLVETDLAGNLVRETNTGRVNEQLQAQGKALIGAFDHEAVRFPNGYTLVQCSVEQLLGSSAKEADPRDVLGDMVVALDPEWNVVWSWNAFEYLDPDRHPNPSETCATGVPGCPPVFKAAVARDWIHGNAIAPSPVDGHLLYSSRSQDWVLKISYGDGAGSGEILWKLGPDGDFSTDSADPFPWNSHQHGIVYAGNDEVSLFDNGNTRCQGLGDCPSRCQVWKLDEAHRTARLEVNTPVGYSLALGYSHRLSNGNFHFTSGFQTGEQIYAENIEVTPSGVVSYILRAPTYSFYRACRVPSLYHAVYRAPVWGDLDGDGLRTPTDITLLQALLSAMRTSVPRGLPSADLDEDGRITALDLLRLVEGYFH